MVFANMLVSRPTNACFFGGLLRVAGEQERFYLVFR